MSFLALSILQSNQILKNIQILSYQITMVFQVLSKYSQHFPTLSHIIDDFSRLYQAKLWNQLSVSILNFLFNPQIKGKVGFDFYLEFVKKFQKNIDQTKLLKIIKQVITSLTDNQKIVFLKEFQEKQAFTEQTKTVVQALEGIVYVTLDFTQCSALISKIEKTLSARKDVDQLVYSTFYEFCMSFYKTKLKYKNFYTSALQYLAYTPLQEIDEEAKIKMLAEMAVSALVSTEIYNFSELLEQPSLVSLKNSSQKWMYELLEIFNVGDILRYEQIDLKNHSILAANKAILEQKIRIMAFLQLVFNLPKSDRVIKFSKIGQHCAIPADHVQFMVMKAMALHLVKGSIDQLNEQVTINWVAPKVLQNERINVMLRKFQEWDLGVQNVYNVIKGKVGLVK